MSSSDDEHDTKRSNEKDRRNDRKSKGDHNRISRELRGSKRSRFGQDDKKKSSISDRRTWSPNRESRGGHYGESRDYRELKRESRRENSQTPRRHRQSKRRRLSRYDQRHLSRSPKRTRFPDRAFGAHTVYPPISTQYIRQLSRYNLPPMMRLRDFPITQERFITENRSLAEHIEYKWHFQRIQLNNFFVSHKDEKWFKNKYHPDDSVKEKERLTFILEKRLEVFKEFLANGKIDSVSVDAENPGPLIHLLDSVIIKLEGGTDFDLTVLNPTGKSIVQQESKHEKKETNKKTNTDVNSDGVLDSDENVGEETNIKDKYVVNKNNEAMNVDVKKPEIFKITNNNNQNNDVKPRALHRTASITLRNLAPTIMKSELETICKQYKGFRRLHLGDPIADHLWHRHGWAIYDGDVRINNIFRNLKPVRLHGNKLDVNGIKKDTIARILPVNGITNHFQVARNDIKLCASIINHFDKRSGLWQSIDGEQPAMETTYGVVSQNPVLHNIIDFITDEASAEEEELLGKSVLYEHEVNTEKHVQLLKSLDRMLLYLRIVHSVDFYNYKDYVHEDGKPSKCNIMHARSAPTIFPPTKREIADYCHFFRSKANSLIVSTKGVSEEELIQLGSRDEGEEVKMFINCNTKKVSTDKWLCHLSGKKFKSAEFVRKHIIKRYTDLLNDVKKEVKYFNNYLRDPNRPQSFPRSRPAPNL